MTCEVAAETLAGADETLAGDVALATPGDALECTTVVALFRSGGSSDVPVALAVGVAALSLDDTAEPVP